MTKIFNSARQEMCYWDPTGFFLWMVLVASCGAVNADPANLYFSLGHGFTKAQKTSYGDLFNKYSVIQKGGREERIAVGRTADHFRFELEGSFYKAAYQSKIISSLLRGVQQKISGMGNLYYDFNKSEEYFNPYLGAGIGVSKIKSVLKTNETNIKQAESKFSFQGIAGLKFNLSSDVSVTVDCRYFTTQKPKFQENKQKVKSINFGVMFKF